MSKTRILKLFIKRALRSPLTWILFITIFFCLGNYFVLHSFEIEKIYIQVPQHSTPKALTKKHFDNDDYYELPGLDQYEKIESSEEYYDNNKKYLKDTKNDLTSYLNITPTAGLENLTNTENVNSPHNKLENLEIPGDMGLPFEVPSYLLEEKEKRFEEFQFNIIASDMISVNRSLPDYRSLECQNMIYSNDLPAASIIIVFRNEAWSTLIRTIWSIINRTPKHLLKEIILVDDASNLDVLGKTLDDYILSITIVSIKLFRMKTRSGLIRARLHGVNNSIGSVILFLDAHCECTDGWIEPLLSRVKENPNTVVAPQIDVISDETFEYQTIVLQTGGFDWLLDFRWIQLSESDIIRIGNNPTEPLRTPIIAGGLIAINKQFFYDIGAYDDEMDIWGSENIEISFRIWQCGGILELIPCSHVGHVYRQTTPHTFPDGARKTIFKNKARVAEVWMDKWKEIFFALNPDAIAGDVTKRKELRNNLNCKDFEWYLKNIYLETNFPLQYNIFGLIKNVETNQCIDGTNEIRTNIEFSNCSISEPYQFFIYVENKTIQSDQICLTQSEINKDHVILEMCDNENSNKNWFYDSETKQFINLKIKKCLMQPIIINDLNPTAILSDCDRNVNRQKWELIKYTN